MRFALGLVACLAAANVEAQLPGPATKTVCNGWAGALCQNPCKALGDLFGTECTQEAEELEDDNLCDPEIIPVPVPVPVVTPGSKTTSKGGKVTTIPVPVPVVTTVMVPLPVPVPRLVSMDSRAPLTYRQPDSDKQWEEYYREYAAKYRPRQELSTLDSTLQARLHNFKRTHAEVQLLREACDCDNYDVDNAFSDWENRAEFSLIQGIEQPASQKRKQMASESAGSASGIRLNGAPKAMDWTQMWDWLPVKDMTQSDFGDRTKCGTDWAVALADLVSSRVTVQSGSVLDLSAQSPFDCGRPSCSGWSMPEVAAFVEKYPKFMARDDYAYLGRQSGKCHYDEDATVAQVTKMSRVDPTVDAVIAALQEGPVLAVVSTISWKTYNKGVLKKCLQNDNFLHAVLIVGYSTDKDGEGPYWKIRNSWGSLWGEDGYIRVAIGNTCGILEDVWTIDAVADTSSSTVVEDAADVQCSSSSCYACGSANCPLDCGLENGICYPKPTLAGRPNVDYASLKEPSSFDAASSESCFYLECTQSDDSEMASDSGDN